MAWVSKKVFAILNGSEEGKDIIEKLPDMTDEEKDSALDKFFGNGGGGNAQAQYYAKAKAEDDEESKSYNVEDDDYEKDIGEDEPSDDDIGSALADSEWRIGDETVGEWAKIIADDLGTDKKRVIDYIRQQDPDKINENTKMEDVVNWFYEERKEENKKFDFKKDLENRVSKNEDYKKMIYEYSSGIPIDLKESAFYSLKNAYEKNGFNPTQKNIEDSAWDEFYYEMNSWQDEHGYDDKYMEENGYWEFEDEVGMTEDEFVSEIVSIWNKNNDYKDKLNDIEAEKKEKNINYNDERIGK